MLGLLLNSNFAACVLRTRNFVDSGLTLAWIQGELNSIELVIQRAQGVTPWRIKTLFKVAQSVSKKTKK
jgi:hypothetical protein